MEVLTMALRKPIKRAPDAFTFDGDHRVLAYVGPGPANLEAAITDMDPFNDEIYWPLRNVIDYLGRMGVGCE